MWRPLLQELLVEKVSTLVFAELVGWLVQRLYNTNFLDGKIVLVEHLNDAELPDLARKLKNLPRAARDPLHGCPGLRRSGGQLEHSALSGQGKRGNDGR